MHWRNYVDCITSFRGKKADTIFFTWHVQDFIHLSDLFTFPCKSRLQFLSNDNIGLFPLLYEICFKMVVLLLKFGAYLFI